MGSIHTSIGTDNFVSVLTFDTLGRYNLERSNSADGKKLSFILTITGTATPTLTHTYCLGSQIPTLTDTQTDSLGLGSRIAKGTHTDSLGSQY